MSISALKKPDYVSTTNACKACMPLGASLAFKGIEGCVPLLHGSQGCATYMRRYLISHFREPVDIASSALGENEAVFGGGANLKTGLVNLINKYQAKAVGVATTCLTETIGDNVPAILREFEGEACIEGGQMPALIPASTPAFGGTHLAGFHAAVAATVQALAQKSAPHGGINLMPGLVSPADLRHLKEICALFKLDALILPDYSRTMDAPAQAEYEVLPAGGTPLQGIKAMGGARASLEFGCGYKGQSAGEILEGSFGVPLVSLDAPIGLRASDAFMQSLEQLGGCEAPPMLTSERGRLLDAMVDGHKYLSGKRAVVYGDEDLVTGLVGFLSEIGVQTVLAASGGGDRPWVRKIHQVSEGMTREKVRVEPRTDFYAIASLAEELKPDFMVGNSKGYRLCRELEVPLVRAGFPIHDRFGGQRLHHLGYRGALELFDRIVNALLEKKQANSPVGYGYL